MRCSFVPLYLQSVCCIIGYCRSCGWRYMGAVWRSAEAWREDHEVEDEWCLERRYTTRAFHRQQFRGTRWANVSVRMCLCHPYVIMYHLSVIHMSQRVTYLSFICYNVSPICHSHVTMCLLSIIHAWPVYAYTCILSPCHLDTSPLQP